VKKIFIVALLIFLISGCKNNLNENLLEEEFYCDVGENYILDCDNFTKIYNEHNNLTSLISKSGISENYHYEYFPNGKVSFIKKEGMEEIYINYDKNDNITKIDYIIDPYIPEKNRTILTYKFYYEDKDILNKVEKTFNNTNSIDIINYEYIDDLIIETKVIGNKKYKRKFQKNENLSSINIFENINYLPNIYIENLKFIPYYSGLDIYYDYKQSPIFVTSLESFEIINLYNNNVDIKNYYYDSYNRFITDSDFKIIHNFEKVNKESEIRYTIYEKELSASYYQYYLYETKYVYNDERLINFTKYKEKEITKQEYEKLKNEYLKVIK